MSKYIAALYSNGKMVTGCNHGDAFSKLSCAEQDGELESGFYDPDTGRFFTEEYDFYLKQIFLVRHGESFGHRHTDDLTPFGQAQIRKTAEFLSGNYDLAAFEGFTSPHVRCRHSADIISQVTGLRISTDCRIREREASESPAAFLARIHQVLADSPAHSIYITHSDFIVNFTEQAVHERLCSDEGMAGGAVTFIDAKRVVYCGASNSIGL